MSTGSGRCLYAKAEYHTTALPNYAERVEGSTVTLKDQATHTSDIENVTMK